jgi:hypothetical protein
MASPITRPVVGHVARLRTAHPHPIGGITPGGELTGLGPTDGAPALGAPAARARGPRTGSTTRPPTMATAATATARSSPEFGSRSRAVTSGASCVRSGATPLVRIRTFRVTKNFRSPHAGGRAARILVAHDPAHVCVPAATDPGTGVSAVEGSVRRARSSHRRTVALSQRAAPLVSGASRRRFQHGACREGAVRLHSDTACRRFRPLIEDPVDLCDRL